MQLFSLTFCFRSSGLKRALDIVENVGKFMIDAAENDHVDRFDWLPSNVLSLSLIRSKVLEGYLSAGNVARLATYLPPLLVDSNILTLDNIMNLVLRHATLEALEWILERGFLSLSPDLDCSLAFLNSDRRVLPYLTERLPNRKAVNVGLDDVVKTNRIDIVREYLQIHPEITPQQVRASPFLFYSFFKKKKMF